MISIHRRLASLTDTGFTRCQFCSCRIIIDLEVMYGMQASHNWLVDSLLTHVAFIDENIVMYLLRKKFKEM